MCLFTQEALNRLYGAVLVSADSLQDPSCLSSCFGYNPQIVDAPAIKPMTTPSNAKLWCVPGEEPVLRVLLKGVMTDIGEPPGASKPFRWKREGDIARRGEYRPPGKRGNVRPKTYNRSRVRKDAGTSKSINTIMGQRSRSNIDVKKKSMGSMPGKCSHH